MKHLRFVAFLFVVGFLFAEDTPPWINMETVLGVIVTPDVPTPLLPINDAQVVLGFNVTPDISPKNIPPGPWDNTPEVIQAAEWLKRCRLKAYQLAEIAGQTLEQEEKVRKQQELENRWLEWVDGFIKYVEYRDSKAQHTAFGVSLIDASSSSHFNEVDGTNVELIALMLDGAVYKSRMNHIVLADENITEEATRILLVRALHPNKDVPYMKDGWYPYGHVYVRKYRAAPENDKDEASTKE